MTGPAAEIDRFGVVGFNHRQVPARQRGLLAFDDAWCATLAQELRAAHLADGVAFVSTCNRQEVVLSAAHPAFALELVRAQLHARLGDQPRPLPEPYRYVGEEAVRHVLRVSASLDSLVVGERQITQQLRRSFDGARREGWLDKALNGLAHIAVENAKEIHNRTSLAAESVGVFTLARDLVFRETASLARPKVAVIGLGEIGLKTARAFVADGRVELVVSSRRARTAAELGTSLSGCRFVPFANLDGLLREMDAVVVATGSSHPVVGEEALGQALSGLARSLVLVDLGIPPQVEATCDGALGTRLFNLDWFTTTGFGQRPQAKEALKHAQEIVEEGVRKLAAWTSVRRYSSLFDSLVTLANAHKQQGIPEALKDGLSVLSAEHQRLVADAMHELLTSYSEGVFQTVTRELIERSQVGAPPADASGEEDVERTDARHRHARE